MFVVCVWCVRRCIGAGATAPAPTAAQAQPALDISATATVFASFLKKKNTTGRIMSSFSGKRSKKRCTRGVERVECVLCASRDGKWMPVTRITTRSSPFFTSWRTTNTRSNKHTMSYNEDAVLSKFSTLNETQESIVNVSQWVMFHKRHASKTAHVWARTLDKTPPPKKLALIYLANEVVQQTRARKKEEFVNAFAEVIVDAVDSSYKQVPKDIKEKIKRVVDVWKQRQIFDKTVLDRLEDRLKGNTNNQSRGLGFGVGIPQELREVVRLDQVIEDSSTPADRNFDATVKSCDHLFNNDALPAPPIYSKQLGELQDSVGKCLKDHEMSLDARRKLSQELRKLLDNNDKTIVRQEKQQEDLKAKLDKIVETKREVDDMIVTDEPEAPEVEAITPPGEPPQLQQPEPSKESMHEEYMPDEDSNNAAPAYSPLSSDEEDEPQQPAKKQKTETSATLEGLDPKVAQLLASMQKKS